MTWVGILILILCIWLAFKVVGLLFKLLLWAAVIVGIWLLRYVEVYPSIYWRSQAAPFGLWEVGVLLGYVGLWGLCYTAFMNAFPRMRATLLTSPHRDEVQVPVDPETMEPLPAHE